MSKRILLIAHSREDVGNLLPLDAALRRMDSAFEPHFVSLERYFGLGVEADLKTANVPFIALENASSISLRGEWRPVQLLKAIDKSAPQIAQLVDESAAVVCGHTGTIERTFARLAHHQGKPTAVFQPGFLMRKDASIRQRGRHTVTRLAAEVLTAVGRREFESRGRGQPFSDFTSVFAMGEDSRQQLVKMGASGNAIVVSGLPRLAPAFAIAARSGTQAKAPVVLYLTGAWRWHGDLRGDALDKDLLRSLCAGAPSWPRLRIRVHPRDDRMAYQWCLEHENVELADPQRSLYEEVADAGVVVARSSTAVFEGVAGGRLGVFIDPPLDEKTAAHWERTGLDRLICEDVSAAIAFINRTYEDPTWAADQQQAQFRSLGRVISSNTPRAAETAAKRIAKDVAVAATNSNTE